MADFRIKRGATLELRMQAREADGAASDLTGMDITVQIRDAGDALVDTLAVTNGGASGLITAIGADTSAWPVGTLRGDVRMVTGGAVAYSDTFTLHVDKAVTVAT